MESVESIGNVVKGSKDDRDNFCFGYIGTNRTGKSTIARVTAEEWREANPDKTIMSFDPQNRFTHLTDIFIDPEDRAWPYKALELRGALLILDDYRLIHEPDKAIPGLGKLFYFRAEYDIDIIYICHHPKLVINTLTYYTSHYYIFFTNSLEGSFKDKIPNYSLCIEASKTINDYVSEHGKGEYPVFPHIIVDCENQVLIYENIYEAWLNQYKQT